MGKYEKKKTKSTAAGISVVVVLAVVLAAVIFFANQNEPGTSGGSASPVTPEIQSGTASTGTVPLESVGSGGVEEEAVSFPFSIADGKLEISSLFQSTGINPDCGNQEGTDIATIVLTNTSGTMLCKATVTATMADGTEIRFQATCLPAGKSAMVFSEENISLSADAACIGVVCEDDWAESSQAMPQGVSASVEGMMVTVTNDTAQDIPELIVYCRTPLGEEYFGGKTYEYTINDLPANGSTTFVAADCIMGLAEVVKIEITQG